MTRKLLTFMTLCNLREQYVLLDGLVVMGGGTGGKGCEFESRHHCMDIFSHLFVVKTVMCV